MGKSLMPNLKLVIGNFKFAAILGAPTRPRSWNLFLKRELLCQLSYGGLRVFYSTIFPVACNGFGLFMSRIGRIRLIGRMCPIICSWHL